VSSEGELEPEVDDNKVVTDEDRAAALELKARANKAFAGGSGARRGGAAVRRCGRASKGPNYGRRGKLMAARCLGDCHGHGDVRTGDGRWCGHHIIGVMGCHWEARCGGHNGGLDVYHTSRIHDSGFRGSGDRRARTSTCVVGVGLGTGRGIDRGAAPGEILRG
jgi:hypothetical protein